MTAFLYQHHKVPAHIWKSTFGNLIGWNTKENREWVTLEQHRDRHLELYARYGRKADLRAAKVIMGAKGREGIIREIRSVVNMGNQNALGSTRLMEESHLQSVRQLGKRRGSYQKRAANDPIVLREQRWRYRKFGTPIPKKG